MTKNEAKKLILFFIISFGFSWAFWIPQALIAQGFDFPDFIVKFLNSNFNIAAFGPLVGAFVMVYSEKGWSGILGFLKRGIDLKFPKKWFIPVLLLMPFITFLAMLWANLFNGFPIDFSVFAKPGYIIYWFFYMLILGGPLQEEFGWRGYALDKLQQKYSALVSSIILGVLWAVWHFPLNFAKLGTGPQYGEAIAMIVGSIITITILSILFTWIYNNTNKSILTVLLFHASLNFSTFKLFPIFESQTTISYYSLLILIMTISVIFIYGKKTLAGSKTS